MSNKSSGSGLDGWRSIRPLNSAHLCLEQVVLPALPVQRPGGHQRSLLIDAESVALVAVHDGEGERRAVVRGVAVGHGELENARARRPVLLQGTEAEGRVLMVRALRWCDVLSFFSFHICKYVCKYVEGR